MSASSSPIQRCADRRVRSLACQRPRERCSTWSPNFERENAAPSGSCWVMVCSARRAAAMLSPVIEPEQSTRIFSAAGAAVSVASMRGQKLTSAAARALPPMPCPTVAMLPCSSPSATSTKSRSRKALRASAMRSTSPSALLSTLMGWLGEETRARVSTPCKRSASSKGYSAVRLCAGS